MNIPEVASLEMKALSRDRIKVGCAEFTRTEVEMVASRVRGMMDATLFFFDKYWYLTYADCARALKLMDEWQEPKPKFKVGDWVRWAGRQILRVEKFDGPVIIGRTLKNDEWRAYPDGLGSYCLESWQPQVGDFVRCTNPSHPGPNPFRIVDGGGESFSYSYESDRANRGRGPYPHHDTNYIGCRRGSLVPAEEPKAEAEFPAALYGKHWRSLGGDLTDMARCVLDLKSEVVLLWAKTGKP